ncbi:MAG: ABC transporter substrate-binding protein [Lachnospiraceae bacterium]|nr:ABC transporter substrate-binding protein [Lachnospiraceae bacterium]
MKKKVLSVLLASAMVMSMAACGSKEEAPAANNNESSAAAPAASSEAAPAASSEAAPAEYQLTEPIKVVVNGTVNYVKEDSGKEEFIAALNEAVSEYMGYDVTFDFTQLDHSGYVDAVGRLFAGGDYPDVMVMSADMFKQYAPTGLLWDMSEAYDNAEFHARMTLPAINENLKDENGALYGFASGYGNGCITYVKQSWLDAVGMKAEDIKTYDDFYNMLTAFTTGDPDGNGVDGDTYGFISAGLLGNEAPFINYTSAFWQDSYPAILQGEDGVWYDGFQTDATKQALLRLQKAYADGVIDPESYTFGTKAAREKYWSADQTGSAGVFEYWAGSWTENIYNNLEKNGVITDLVSLPPIAEVGAYLNREAPVWVIIDDGDGDNARENAIFKAFCESMLDGDKIQTLWTYGVEDVHWSLKAESITSGSGEKEKTVEYKEGEFHFRNTFADPTQLFKKNNIDNALVVSPLTNGYSDSSDMVDAANKFFTENCVDAPVSPASETLTNESGNIHDAKMAAISAVVIEGGDVDAAMETYVNTVGATVEQILSELNG